MPVPAEITMLSRAGALPWMLSAAPLTLSLHNPAAKFARFSSLKIYPHCMAHPPFHYCTMMNRRKQTTSICPSFGGDETVISDLRHDPCALAAQRNTN
ncbi:hypothetical protein DPSP01_002073 [Paraphaeosphaeria sporulosa]